LTRHLTAVSPTLPTLVAGAYSQFSRRQLAEALMDAWIVIEPVVDWWWKQYTDGVTDRKRRERLKDTRVYTASVRAEVLRTAGALNSDLYAAIERARGHRNAAAHRAAIRFEATDE